MNSDYPATFPERYEVKDPLILEADSQIDREKVQLVSWLNKELLTDKKITQEYKYMPIKEEGNDFFYALSDGVIVKHIINKFYNQYNIDVKYGKAGLISKNANITNVIKIANIILSKGVTISESNLSTPNKTTASLVLGFIWMLFDKFQEKDIKLSMKEKGVDVSMEEFLLNWVNKALEEEGVDKRINNFGSDIKDSEAYLYLLHHLNNNCSLEALNSSNLIVRATSF
ncbi:plastin-2, putative [Entamoeba histolytica HM-1:IMSS]|uniref:Plastin-2, putative n=1 Tax=Entamoeba histolytica (strain ATCC 30459 / HM-1:IMSS / ABRM) TaxID=294381 RepID=C4MBS6_ENTH1|nr:plastin-2, putative [Entamoeba histolytica HM-1:IMSS]EAL45060.2 plastin-2, putative [Entamoeba histolytica HM-1:IMSS]|eukprot:XP_650449.2 plastin-2, putative [Entamoeba histolytica HM-1:IMSS]